MLRSQRMGMRNPTGEGRVASQSPGMNGKDAGPGHAIPLIDIGPFLRGEDGATEWLEKFAAQQPKAYEGNSQVRDAVDAGEVEVGLVNHYYLLEKLSETGGTGVVAKNQFVGGGDPGGLVNVAGVGILKSSDNKAAAQAFVDYLLAKGAQTYFAERTFEYPLVEGVPAAADLPPLDELDAPTLDLSDLDSLAATQELLAQTGLLQK